MNIGILTQPLKGNYGGILQNYALQQILMQLGHAPVTLDYMWGATGIDYAILALRVTIARLRGRTSRGLPKYAPTRTKSEVIDFVNKHILTSHTFWNKYKRNLIDRYRLDAIIVGSDQVWRPQYNPRLEDSYLSFTKRSDIKRIAYAASFGTSDFEYTRDQIKLCGNLLKNFDAVSVREKSALDILAKLGRTDAEVVLDPTLLLGRQGFEKILPSTDGTESKRPYIGIYILDNTPGIENALRENTNVSATQEIVRVSVDTPGIGPVEWIDTIRKAERFITDSFHGTVFCILFHIPFVSIVNKNRGADRFDSLLSPLGLSDHMVYDVNDIAEHRFHADWGDVDRRLDDLRKESMNFIIESLS